MSPSFVRYDDPNVEPSVPDEPQLQQKIRDLITRVQSHNLSLHRHGFRGTHVKTQGILKGTFSVAPDLPAHLAVGICSPANANRTHPIGIRYANEPSFLTADNAPGPRGCGLRIFDVEGSFLSPEGKESRTQDLTFNNAPVLELKDVKTCVEIFEIRERHFREPEKIKPELEKREDKELQLAPMGLPNKHLLGMTMYSQSAYRWGDAVVKYALFPVGEAQKGLDELDVTEPEQHSKWLAEFFQEKDAEFELRVQVCKDLEKQSVEDTSVEWDEEQFPFETVGKVVLPRGQDPFSAKRRAFWDDGMKLNVWYGLEEHRPLGSANRLRRELYPKSAANRTEMNAREISNVKSINDIPN